MTSIRNEQSDRSSCPSCGNSVAIGAQFCGFPSCGSYLDWSQSSHVARPEKEDAESTSDGRTAAGEGTHQIWSEIRSAQPLVVAPGDSSSAEVRVINHGDRVDQIHLTLTGPLAEMSSVFPQILRLYPGEEAHAEVVVAPPRCPTPRAGRYGYQLLVESTQGQGREHHEGSVLLTPFSELEAVLEPRRTTRRLSRFEHRVTVGNRGNATARIAIVPKDPARIVRWMPSHHLLELLPDRQVIVPLKGRRKLTWWAPAESIEFAVSIAHAVRDGETSVIQQSGLLHGVHERRPLLPRWLAPLLLMIGATLAAAVMVFFPDGLATVPSVAGQDQSAAVATIKKVGLEARISTQTSDDVAPSKVISTDPPAGTSLPTGEVVTLNVSSGPPVPDTAEVSNVVGLEASEAEAELQDAGLDTRTIEESDPNVAQGAVIRTTPEAGLQVKLGTVVTLYVSTGPPPPEQVIVPDVVGMQRDQATTVLNGSALHVSKVEEEASEEEEGVVLRTDPSAGDTVDKDTAIILYVSTGPDEPAPDPSDGPEDPEDPELPPLLVGVWRSDPQDLPSRELRFTPDATFQITDESGATLEIGTVTVEGPRMTWATSDGDIQKMSWEVSQDSGNRKVLRLVGEAESLWMR